VDNWQINLNNFLIFDINIFLILENSRIHKTTDFKRNGTL
jgi:hypothetical protein